MLRFDRRQQNSVKQLSLNYKKNNKFLKKVKVIEAACVSDLCFLCVVLRYFGGWGARQSVILVRGGNERRVVAKAG